MGNNKSKKTTSTKVESRLPNDSKNWKWIPILGGTAVAAFGLAKLLHVAPENINNRGKVITRISGGFALLFVAFYTIAKPVPFSFEVSATSSQRVDATFEVWTINISNYWVPGRSEKQLFLECTAQGKAVYAEPPIDRKNAIVEFNVGPTDSRKVIKFKIDNPTWFNGYSVELFTTPVGEGSPFCEYENSINFVGSAT